MKIKSRDEMPVKIKDKLWGRKSNLSTEYMYNNYEVLYPLYPLLLDSQYNSKNEWVIEIYYVLI